MLTDLSAFYGDELHPVNKIVLSQINYLKQSRFFACKSLSSKIFFKNPQLEAVQGATLNFHDYFFQ